MTEDAVRTRQRPAQEPSPGPTVAPTADNSAAPRRGRLRPPGVLELEEHLAERLSTRVTIQMGGGTGKVVVEFADLEDLERIAQLIAPWSTPDAP